MGTVGSREYWGRRGAPILSERRGQADRQRVIITANALWNMRNFRAGLFDALIGTGWDVLFAAPDADHSWAAVRGAELADIRVDQSGMNPIRASHCFPTIID